MNPNPRRRGLPLRGLLPTLGLVAATGVLTGCGESEVADVLAASSDAEAVATGLAGLSLEDLPAELELSADQRAVLATALAELASSRAELCAKFEGVRAERRGRRGDGGGDGPPDPAACDRDGAGRGGPGGLGGPLGAGGLADFEPPLVTFLTTAAETLDRDQFVLLASTIAENRPERPGGARGIDRGRDGEGRGGRFSGRMAARFAAEFDLTESQVARLAEIRSETREALRDLREAVRDGSTSPQDALTQAVALTAAAKAELATLLDAEQLEQLGDRRERRRAEGIEERLSSLDERLEGRAAMISAALDLDSAGAGQVRAILLGTTEARRAVLADLESGAAEPELTLFRVLVIEQEAADAIRALLTPEQQVGWDALRELLPGRGLGPR